MKFEWDPKKALLNARKHGVTFEEASALFRKPSEYIELFDETHSKDEDRFIAIGPISKGIVVVIYVERTADLIRLISARKATRTEKTLFSRFKNGEPI